MLAINALLLDPVIPAGTQTFNSSGNFTIPYGVRVITVAGTGGDGTNGTAGNPGTNGTAGTAVTVALSSSADLEFAAGEKVKLRTSPSGSGVISAFTVVYEFEPSRGL